MHVEVSWKAEAVGSAAELHAVLERSHVDLNAGAAIGTELTSEDLIELGIEDEFRELGRIRPLPPTFLSRALSRATAVSLMLLVTCIYLPDRCLTCVKRVSREAR